MTIQCLFYPPHLFPRPWINFKYFYKSTNSYPFILLENHFHGLCCYFFQLYELIFIIF